MTLTTELAREALELVALRLGLHLPAERQRDLERGLAAAAAHSGGSFTACLERLRNLPGESAEWTALAASLTVGETYFFRDPATFEALEQRVLPDLIAERRRLGNLRLRIWSAGCASGEEPYSLAILLDRLLPDRERWSLTLLATDLNQASLESARRGLYREWALRATPAGLRDRYFEPRRDGFRLDRRIRDMVAFAPLNLADGAYPDAMTNTSAMDLVLCRNVVMYFRPDVQRDVLARLGRALAEGGWLGVSPAEANNDLLRPLQPVAFAGALLYRKTAGATPTVEAASTGDGAFAWPSLAEPPAAGADWRPAASDAAGPFAAYAAAPATAETAAGAAAGEASSGREPPNALARARGLADLGRLEEAGAICRSVLAADRLDVEAHVLLAAIAQELGETGAALDALRGAVYLAPDSAAAHFMLGTLLWRQGEQRRARRALQAAVALLDGLPAGEPVPGCGGPTAERLKRTARSYLEER